MISTEVIVVGDLHLEGLNTLFSSGDDKIYACLDQVVKYAEENDVSTIIITGDIINNASPEQDTLTRLLRYCILHGHLHWYFILGNHDIHSTDKHSSEFIEFIHKHKLVPNIHFYEQETLEYVNKVPFVFLPYPLVKRQTTKFPTVNVAHIETLGAKYENGRVITKGISLNKSVDYWIIGHLHSYQVYERVVYPGMMYQKTFGDDKKKGFLHCTIKWSSTKLNVTHKFIPISLPFRLHTIDVNSVDDLNQVKKSESELYKLFVRSNIVIPSSFLSDYPNVIKHQPFKDNNELAAYKAGDYSLDEVQAADTKKLATRDLSEFLRLKKFDVSKIKRAKGIVTAMINDIVAEDS